jgi:DNA-binding CsgD family transcriptional regulator
MGSAIKSNPGAQVGGMRWKSVQLSDSEKRVAGLVALGCADDEIARQMTVKTYSIKEHIASLLDKIDGKERVEILFYVYSEPSLCPGVAAMARYDELAPGSNLSERKAS